MTDNEKKLIQARHRLEEAQARDRVKQRKARTRRLIQEGAVLEKALPQTVSMSLNELETYLHELRSCIHKRLSKVWKWEILTMASADETEIS